MESTYTRMVILVTSCVILILQSSIKLLKSSDYLVFHQGIFYQNMGKRSNVYGHSLISLMNKKHLKYSVWYVLCIICCRTRGWRGATVVAVPERFLTDFHLNWLVMWCINVSCLSVSARSSGWDCRVSNDEVSETRNTRVYPLWPNT